MFHAFDKPGAPPSPDRAGWMALLSRAPVALLEQGLGTWCEHPVHWLRPPETGLMMDTVRRIKAQGVTIILIEHVMRFLVALSDRVMILHHGERIYEGPAAGLVRDKTVVDVYLGEGASARLAAMLERPAP